MSTSIETLADELETRTKYQRTPSTVTTSEYIEMTTTGIKKFYIDVGLQGSWLTEYNSTTNTITRTLNILEQEYCLLASENVFYDMLKGSWNALVGYTTNALSITNANKPFEFLSQTVNKNKAEMVSLFHKMTDKSTMTDVSAVNIVPVDYTFGN